MFYRNGQRPMALTKALKSEKEQQTGNSPFVGLWRKGQFSRLLLTSFHIEWISSSTIVASVYRDFADTIARKAACGRMGGRFFFFYSCRDWTNGTSTKRKRIWKNITIVRSNGMDGPLFSFLPSSSRGERQMVELKREPNARKQTR